MRVSENMKTMSLFTDLNRTMERMMESQDELATSKRIQEPSDDPGGTARLLNLKAYFSRYERYDKNAEDGCHWLTATESALQGIIDGITVVDGTLLQASNDTLSDAERKILAGQMYEMYAQIVGLVNKKFGDRFLFGGTENSTAPYTLSDQIEDETFTSAHDTAVGLENVDLTAGSVVVTSADGLTTYVEGVDYTIDYDFGRVTVLGSGGMADATDHLISYDTEKPYVAVLNPDGVDGALMRKIDEGISVQINISATSIFSDTNGLLDVLRKAIVDLERNERDGISDARQKVADNSNVLTRVIGEVGSKIGRMELQQDKLAADKLNLERLISTIEDADIASAIIRFQKDQFVYQAALRTGADLIQMSLLDFIR